MSKRLRFGRLVLLVLIAIGLLACGSAEERKAAHLSKGLTLYEQGDYVKARLEFKNVLQIDPKDADARYMLAQTNEREGQWREAFGNYFRVVRLQPERWDARVRLGNIYLLSGDRDKALEQASAVLQERPDDPDALVLRGMIRAREGELAASREDARRALDKSPGHTASTALLAWIYSRQDKTDEAVAVLREALPQSTPHDAARLKVVLGGVYADAKDYRRAAQTFEELVAARPDKASYRRRLSQLYVQIGQLDRAEQLLREGLAQEADLNQARLSLAEFLARHRSVNAAERQLRAFIEQDPQEPGLQFALARLYAKTGQRDEAKRLLERIVGTGDGAAAAKARNRLAGLLVEEGRLDRAVALAQEVLARHPADTQALMVRARVALERQDADGLISDSRMVLKNRPDSREALRLLARGYVLRNEPELAKDALERAIELKQDDPQDYLDLAKLELGAGDAAGAESTLRALVEVAPKRAEGLEALTRFYIGRKEWISAAQTAERLQGLAGDRMTGYYLKGLADQGRQRWAQSVEELSAAMQRAPNAVEPVVAIARSYFAMGRPQDAVARVQEVVKAHPDSPMAYKLLGEIYHAEGDGSRAVAALRKAIELAPEWDQPYLQLGGLYLDDGETEQAIKAFGAGLQALPADAGLALQLALAYEEAGDIQGAIATLEGVIAHHPGLSVVANNLAMVLIEHQPDPQHLDEALSLARAFEGTRNPLFRDTLGWVYYRRGEYAKAIEVFERVLASAPDVPVFNYHAGMAYLKAGRTAEARQHLAKALRGEADFSGVEEARQALASL